MPAHTEGLDLAWWQASLAATTSIEGITALAREYLTHLDAERLSRLPLPCRPGKLSTAQDVADYAYELVRYHCDTDENDVAGTIQDLAAFFSEAAVTLSKLATPPPTSSELVQLFEYE